MIMVSTNILDVHLTSQQKPVIVELAHIKRQKIFNGYFLEKTRPDSDCDFQSCVYSILEIASNRYGLPWIRLDDATIVLRHALSDVDWLPKQDVEVKNLLIDCLIKLASCTVSQHKQPQISMLNAFILRPAFFEVSRFKKLYTRCFETFSKMYPYPTFKDNILNQLDTKLKDLLSSVEKKHHDIRFHATRGFGKRRDEIYTVILDMLDEAKKSIKLMVAYYSQDLKALARLLGIKASQGIPVKLILRWADDSKEDNKNLIEEIFRTFDFKGTGWESFQYALYPNFKGTVHKSILTFTYLHAKMLVTDSFKVLIGSANLTIPSLRRNIEVAISTTHRPVVTEAEKFFDEVWNSLEVNPQIV